MKRLAKLAKPPPKLSSPMAAEKLVAPDATANPSKPAAPGKDMKFDELALAVRVFSDPAAGSLRAEDRAKVSSKPELAQANDLILVVDRSKQSAHAVNLTVKNAGSSGLLWERDDCIEVTPG